MTELFSPAVLLALSVTLFAGLTTVLGSFLVIFARQDNSRLLAFALAFAAGAMVYVSLVEIFPKGVAQIELSTDHRSAYALATVCLFVGVGLLVLLDRLLPQHHEPPQQPTSGVAGEDSSLVSLASPARTKAAEQRAIARLGLLAAAAITAHNLPEGLATFFATLDSPVVGAPLAVAIAVHNIPEGVSIAVPVYYATGSKSKAVWAALLSGLAEPVGALIGYLLLAPFLSPLVFGIVFAIIAGAMVFLSLDELLPAANRYARGHETVYGMVAGMAVLALSLVLFK